MKQQKLVVWMNMPSHHQSDYFKELSLLTKLRINYTGKQDKRRKALGWRSPSLNSFEKYRTFIFSYLFSLFRHRDSIHVITGCGNLPNILIWLTCRIFKIRWCHLSENIPTDNKRSKIKNLIVTSYYKSVNKNALCAFAIGNKAKRSFEYFGVDAAKISITNYSSPIEKSAYCNTPPELPIKALVLGQISSTKGSDILLDLVSSFTETLLVDFYGSVSKDNTHFIHQINTTENTQYLGVISSDKVKKLWSQYNLLIFPSRVDGWGMAVHEAIANNVPVICSEEAGCSEHLIIDGYNGFRIPAEQTHLSRAINKYINDPTLLCSQANNCNEQKKKFSPKVTAQNFMKNLTQSIT